MMSIPISTPCLGPAFSYGLSSRSETLTYLMPVRVTLAFSLGYGLGDIAGFLKE